MGQKGFELCCKVRKCKESYVAKWLLIAHLMMVHEFTVEKGNLGHLSTCERVPKCQNHLVMNLRILNDAQSIL